jgi:hypothetical protein
MYSMSRASAKEKADAWPSETNDWWLHTVWHPGSIEGLRPTQWRRRLPGSNRALWWPRRVPYWDARWRLSPCQSRHHINAFWFVLSTVDTQSRAYWYERFNFFRKTISSVAEINNLQCLPAFYVLSTIVKRDAKNHSEKSRLKENSPYPYR